jgi:GrpB-like predicted nucleotidyltransferase (UPF0157 family)
MIEIVPYKPTWPDEFNAIGRRIRQALGDLALRIDHIGSTAVPGLAAKDKIDIQVTVASLSPEIESAMARAGLSRVQQITQDHVPPGFEGPADEWTKWIFRPVPGQRSANVHVRLAGRANQRYALLFRDYLRIFPSSAQAYAQVKVTLACFHADDAEVYYEVKDPVCDLIVQGAELWATRTAWQMGTSDA